MPQSDVGGCVSVHLTAIGVPVTVTVLGSGAEALATEVARVWEWCRRDPSYAEPDDGLTVTLVLDEGRNRGPEPRVIVSADPAELLHQLSPAITLGAITRLGTTLLACHAGAVCDIRTGATVALIGASGAGKTTAVRTLARTLGYVSDETLALRDDDTVVPYPKPLSVMDGSQFKRQVAPSDCGLQPPAGDCRLVRLLLLERSEESPLLPELTVVPTVHALAELSPQISFFAVHHQPLQRLARTLRSTGGLVRVRYREAADLVEPVTAMLEAAR